MTRSTTADSRRPDRPRRRSRGQQGAALVEFALILPILMAVIMGMFTGGIAMFQKVTLTGSAREGARAASVLPPAQCTPTTRCSGKTWAQFVQNEVVTNSGGTLTAAQVCVALVSGSSSAPVAVDTGSTTAGGTSPCFTDDSSDTAKRVQVKVTRPATIQAVIYSQTLTLTSRAVSRFEQ